MKINKPELFKTAWKIARIASEKFNQSIRIFFSEALKQAWDIVKNKTNSILDRIKNHPAIESFSEWKKSDFDRIYFNLKGYDKDVRGCRTTKVYFDKKSEKLYMKKCGFPKTKQFQNGIWDILEMFDDDENFEYISA